MKSAVLKEYFGEQVRRCQETLGKLRERTTKKRIYKLRVGLRRLRTILEVLDRNRAPVLSEEQRLELAKIWKELGYLRDVDVAIALAKKFDLDRKELKRKREGLRKGVEKVLQKRTLGEILQTLSAAARELDEAALEPKGLIKKLEQKVSGGFNHLKELHDLRILIKKVRYLSEGMGLLEPKLKRYQDVLGKLNDLDLFLELHGPHPAVELRRKSQFIKAFKDMPSARKQALETLKALKAAAASK